MENKEFVFVDNRTKMEKFKDKVTDAKDKTVDFVKEHWFELMIFVPMGFKAVSSCSKSIRSMGPTQYEKERYRKDTTYFDPRTGIRWRLKRKLTMAETMELERRRDYENVGDILKSMNALAR